MSTMESLGMRTDSTRLSALIQFFGGTINSSAIAEHVQSQIIGSDDEAIIAEGFGYSYYDENRQMPDGWKFLGQGSYRSAFLAPSGTVYKVQESNIGSDCNAIEAEAYVSLSPNLPKRIRLARCFIWSDTVIAMEFVDMSRTFEPIDSRELLRTFARISGCYDVEHHRGNYGWDVNGLVVTDFSI